MEELCSWVASFPGFCDFCFAQDRLESQCYAAGVFYKGEQALSRQADVTGMTFTRRRLSLSVLLTVPQGQPLGDTLLEFSHWAETTAPRLGAQQQVSAGKAGIRRNDGKGVATYEISLEIDYTTREDSL